MKPLPRQLVIQFIQYLLSGGVATVLSIGAYAVLVKLGVWYMAASVISDAIGLLLVFLFTKYLIFQKKEQVVPDAFRYLLVQVANTVIQLGIVYVLVSFVGLEEVLSKTIAIVACVPLNFVLYKYFVYV